MKKHIVCFGDSNTHGYCADPNDCADGGIRFNEDERWPMVLQKLLGDEYLVTEEGLSGRTSCFDDPIHEGLNGLDYIYPCLKSHEFVDLLIIMLGTNDTKDRFSSSAFCIALGLARLVKKAKDTECWKYGNPHILVVCPPPIGRELNDPGMGEHCAEKSEQLPKYLEEQCRLLGVDYLDAAKIGAEFNKVDYMHLTKKGHRALAGALSERIKYIV